MSARYLLLYIMHVILLSVSEFKNFYISINRFDSNAIEIYILFFELYFSSEKCIYEKCFSDTFTKGRTDRVLTCVKCYQRKIIGFGEERDVF